MYHDSKQTECNGETRQATEPREEILVGPGAESGRYKPRGSEVALRSSLYVWAQQSPPSAAYAQHDSCRFLFQCIQLHLAACGTLYRNPSRTEVPHLQGKNDEWLFIYAHVTHTMGARSGYLLIYDTAKGCHQQRSNCDLYRPCVGLLN